MDKKAFNKIKKQIKLPLVIFLLVVILVSVISINIVSDARGIGRTLGNAYGSIIGNMKGSYDGHNAGEQKGKEDAKIPLDPNVTIEQKIMQQGKLHVMSVSLDITDCMKKGEGEETKVAILFSQKATADYSVDLTQVIVNEKQDNLLITVPDVTVEYIEGKDTYEELDMYLGKDEYSGDAFEMRKESDKAISIKTQNEFNDENNGIKIQARDTARKQIIDLVKTITGKSVSVQFVTEGGEYRWKENPLK